MKGISKAQVVKKNAQVHALHRTRKNIFSRMKNIRNLYIKKAVLNEFGDLFGAGLTGEHELSATAPLFTDRTPVVALQRPAPGRTRAPPKNEKTTGAGIALTEG